jgi:hypothetical protein
MLIRRNWVVVAVALFLVASLAACAAPVAVPERDIEISVDTALEAQAKLNDLMMGGVEWSESEFSSLLSVLLDQNSGENNPVEAVHVWFEPDNKVVARVALVDGVLPATFAGSTLDLAGTVGAEGGVLMLDLEGASAGGFGVDPALLAPVNDQINAALAGLGLGIPVVVSTDTGAVMVGLGM